MTLHYVSLFSGIEAFSVAASRCQEADFKPVFFSEIDPFPCAVLAHHYPNTPNLGDICKIRIDHDTNTATNGTTTVALPRTGIDILAGGSPCQDVSVAGRRAGMSEGSGTRSALAFEYARLVEELRPRVILWENVPGVLSSNGGLDFAAFLDTLGKLGYRSLAYRVLDAQYTRVDGFPRGVPQRRKRVWLVGCLGTDESVPAQILFEFPRVLGDSPPRREAGKGFAAPAGYCATGDDRVVGGAGARVSGFGKYKIDNCAACLRRESGDCGDGSETLAVAAPLCATNSNGEDVAPTLDHNTGATNGIGAQNDKRGGYILATFGKTGHAMNAEGDGEKYDAVDVAQTLNTFQNANESRAVELVAVKTANTASNGGNANATGAGYTLDGTGGHAVAVGFNVCTSPRFPDGGAKVETAGTLAVDHREGCATMLKVRCGADTYIKRDGTIGTAGRGPLASEESAFTLAATQDQSLVLRHIVRRLTPVECERLQGFPDNYTRIPYRNKPAEECPDSPRYKALGNSWATNCAEWILRRICAAFRLGMI